MAKKVVRWIGVMAVGAALVTWWRSRRSSDRLVEPDVDPVRAIEVVPDLQPEPAVSAAWADPIDGECPDGFPVKVNERSGIFHVPGGLSYDRTRPTRCYATPEGAEADGFRRARR